MWSRTPPVCGTGFGTGREAISRPVGRRKRLQPAVQQRGLPRGTGPDFAPFQLSHIRAFRKGRAPDGAGARVSQGLVVIPTDSASPGQRENYRATWRTGTPRTATRRGPTACCSRRISSAPVEQIAEQLYAHAAFQEVDEVAFALPFSFEPDDYVQILTDIAGTLGPALGWTPAEVADAPK